MIEQMCIAVTPEITDLLMRQAPVAFGVSGGA